MLLRWRSTAASAVRVDSPPEATNGQRGRRLEEEHGSRGASFDPTRLHLEHLNATPRTVSREDDDSGVQPGTLVLSANTPRRWNKLMWCTRSWLYSLALSTGEEFLL
nr:uncharacterized protein LOC123494030 [Aegilops tauschii subsp. strangulata]